MWAKKPENPKGSIVFLHGRTWSGVPDFDLQVEGEHRSVMDAFIEQGYATYALDLRGYGESPRDETGWLTPDRAAKDLGAALIWVHEQAKNDAPRIQPAPRRSRSKPQSTPPPPSRSPQCRSSKP